jgi:hypothetical protein
MVGTFEKVIIRSARGGMDSARSAPYRPCLHFFPSKRWLGADQWQTQLMERSTATMSRPAHASDEQTAKRITNSRQSTEQGSQWQSQSFQPQRLQLVKMNLRPKRPPPISTLGFVQQPELDKRQRPRKCADGHSQLITIDTVLLSSSCRWCDAIQQTGS